MAMPGQNSPEFIKACHDSKQASLVPNSAVNNSPAVKRMSSMRLVGGPAPSLLIRGMGQLEYPSIDFGRGVKS